MSNETDRDRQRRAVETAETISKRVADWCYKPPERRLAQLWELYELLGEHFGESNAKAEIVHVGAILYAVEKRRVEEPKFSKALDDYLATKRTQETGESASD